MGDQPQRATPPEQLLAELMDSRIPKNEREHFAARHIADLERQLQERIDAPANLLARVVHAESRAEAAELANSATAIHVVHVTAELERHKAFKRAVMAAAEVWEQVPSDSLSVTVADCAKDVFAAHRKHLGDE